MKRFLVSAGLLALLYGCTFRGQSTARHAVGAEEEADAVGVILSVPLKTPVEKSDPVQLSSTATNAVGTSQGLEAAEPGQVASANLRGTGITSAHGVATMRKSEQGHISLSVDLLKAPAGSHALYAVAGSCPREAVHSSYCSGDAREGAYIGQLVIGNEGPGSRRFFTNHDKAGEWLGRTLALYTVVNQAGPVAYDSDCFAIACGRIVPKMKRR